MRNVKRQSMVGASAVNGGKAFDFTGIDFSGLSLHDDDEDEEEEEEEEAEDLSEDNGRYCCTDDDDNDDQRGDEEVVHEDLYEFDMEQFTP